jgi:hypothetical protein
MGRRVCRRPRRDPNRRCCHCCWWRGRMLLSAPPTQAETPPTDHPAAAKPAAVRPESPPRSPARAPRGRRIRLTQVALTASALAKSSIVACTPSSSIFRHRNARASALTMALSTRGRGAHAAPSGVTTSFRPKGHNQRHVDGDGLTVHQSRALYNRPAGGHLAR